MKQKVSVIIPAYNAEGYISRMLESILNQTYDNIECIIIDDGSTDNTYKTIKQYKEKFVKKRKILKLLHQENKGQAAALNLGLKQVTGEYIIWADSDDYFELDAFEAMVDCLEKNKDRDLVRANAVTRLEDNIKEIYEKREQKDYTQKNILDDYIIAKQDKIPTYIGIIMTRFSYFKEKNKGIEIDESRVGQNLQMIIPITYNAKAYCLNKVVYNYIIRQDSHSRTKKTTIQGIKKMLNSKNLRIRIIKKVMEKQDIKKYVRLTRKTFYKLLIVKLFLVPDVSY